MWHASSRSGEATLRTAIHFYLLTYLLTHTHTRTHTHSRIADRLLYLAHEDGGGQLDSSRREGGARTATGGRAAELIIIIIINIINIFLQRHKVVTSEAPWTGSVLPRSGKRESPRKDERL